MVIFEATNPELEAIVLKDLGKGVAPPEISPEEAQFVDYMKRILNRGSSSSIEGLSQSKAEGIRSIRPVLDMVVERDSQNPSYVGVRIHIVDRGTWKLGNRLAWDDEGIHSFLQGAVDMLKLKIEDMLSYAPRISVEMVYRQQS